jgi:predicted O-methyltransferase YrrM
MLRNSTDSVSELFDFIKKTIPTKTAIDKCHNLLLFGTIVSAKPQAVLELGIGMGYATQSILFGLGYNGVGRLTCVDSCKDFDSKEPTHFSALRTLGADIIIKQEEEFIKSQQKNTFDFLVSDADHKNTINWIDSTVALLKSGSIMFFHDTNLPPLIELESALNKRSLSTYHFKKSSRNDERCERGWLMAFKQ